MPTKRTAWKEAAWVFVLSRVVIIVITFVGSARFPLSGRSSMRGCDVDINACLLSWLHWDVNAYSIIAQHGYLSERDTVFFPLWPLLVHWPGILFGASFYAYYAASTLLANVCFYMALVVFYKLISEDFEATVAKNALFYMAFYPYSLFFFAGYAESLFLLLCLSVFFFLRRGNSLDWWLAGLCGFLAALTRPPGSILAVPFLIVFLQRFWFHGGRQQTNWHQKIRAFTPIALIPLGVIIFMLYLGYTKGNPFLSSVEEAVSWHRHLSAPWSGPFLAIKALFDPTMPRILNVLDLTFTLMPLLALVIGWKRLPLHYSLFALVMVLFALCYPQGTNVPLTAAPRYMMVIFPIIVLFALWGKHPRFDKLFLAFSLPLFAVNIVLFISHYWVA
jgi:Mannosyltransferase (PIG-V)